MSITLRARADARALAGAAVLGSLVGLAIGGAYLAGGMARAAVVHAQISRLAATSDGFSESALAASSVQDPGAMAIAKRHAPASEAAPDVSERRLAAYGERLQAHLDRKGAVPSGQVARVSFNAASTIVPAKPFRMRGALAASRDLQCLTQAVYYEARGETRSGQQAVAQVVLNRTRHPAFPNSVCGVVFQRTSGTCQFSFACDGSVDRRVDLRAWRRAEQVAAKALEGAVMSEVGNATHFHVARINPAWGGRLMRVSQVGSHVFYSFGGRAGSARAFSETPEPSEPTPAPATEVQPVYASLSLAPLANTVAATVANSVASTVAAGAEFVAAAARPHVEPAPQKPLITVAPLAVPPPPSAPAVAEDDAGKAIATAS